MAQAREPEVLVIGAGPVGLVGALALTRNGIHVRVVDSQWRTGAHSYALALHRSSVRLLERLGLNVRQQGYPIESIALYEGPELRAEVPFPRAEDGCPGLIVLRQDVFEGLLEQALRQQGALVFWNQHVSDLVPERNAVRVTIDRREKQSLGYAVAHTEWVVSGTTQLTVPLVLAADGHRSRTRRGLAIEFPQVGPTEHYAVFECSCPEPLPNQVRVVLGPETTDVLWPMPDGRCRWSFQMLDHAAAESSRMKQRLAVHVGDDAFPMLSEQRFQELVHQRAPWFERNIGDIYWRIAVRFERRLASSLGRGRVWMAGDAAHITGPAGMHSMNSGIREAVELAQLYTGVLREGHALSEFPDYEQKCLAEWRGLLGLTGRAGLQPQTPEWVRQRPLNILDCLPAAGEERRQMAAQLGLSPSP